MCMLYDYVSKKLAKKLLRRFIFVPFQFCTLGLQVVLISQGCQRTWKTQKTWNNLEFIIGAWKTFKTLKLT